MDESNGGRRRPSPSLLVVGLISLVVGVSALVGPSTLHAVGNLEFRWVFVVAALGAGAALLIIPSSHNSNKPR